VLSGGKDAVDALGGAGGSVLQFANSTGGAALHTATNVGKQAGKGLSTVAHTSIDVGFKAGGVSYSSHTSLLESSSSFAAPGVSYQQSQGGSSIAQIFDRDTSSNLGGLQSASHDNGLWSTNSVGGVGYVAPGYMVTGGLDSAVDLLAGNNSRAHQQQPRPARRGGFVAQYGLATVHEHTSHVGQHKASSGYSVEETVAAIANVTKKDPSVVSSALRGVIEGRELEPISTKEIKKTLEQLHIKESIGATIKVVAAINEAREKSGIQR
jgi:hypothetical protein